MSARKVTVGLLDITNAIRKSSTDNPISRCISKVFGQAQVELVRTNEGLEARIGEKGSARYLRYWLPADITMKLAEWNDTGMMRTFSFNIPEADLIPEVPVTYVQDED